MKQRRVRSGSEAGLPGGPGVEPAADARGREVVEALEGGPAGGFRPGAERPRRFFIVSVSEDATGELHGVVEAVRSGRKERFQGLDTLGSVVGAMFRRLRDNETAANNKLLTRSGHGLPSHHGGALVNEQDPVGRQASEKTPSVKPRVPPQVSRT